ncbi:peptidase [Putridiphycobacter roseus]|uniref:Peptidase n=1 Tax=Putridiphycobacter roseus TaxID=2219161 RepID=A0A2W1NH45_9FLAO|nr:RimK/LysX family protein [Putridiphycobacter roseus]PZE18423.1 peptidase [Putridiphycobacter roseus]
MKDRITIGRVDKVDFVELGLENIDVKMDTGAYTSSIHCSKIEEHIYDGVPVIEFQLLDESFPEPHDRVHRLTHYRKKDIKSSCGTVQSRFIIQTEITMFGKVLPIELSLTERWEMKFPILIGRSFLNGKFVVDTAKTNSSYKAKQKHVAK